MTQTWEEWKKENNFNAVFSEEVLKQALLCRGKAVVLRQSLMNAAGKRINWFLNQSDPILK